jgi:hypothetical protein
MKRIAKIIATAITILALSLMLGFVSSRTVRAAVTALVTVANTPANPVPATDVGPQQPYLTSCTSTVYYFTNGCGISVPSGKRFVVENVSLYVQGGSNVQLVGAGIIPDANNPPPVIFYINVPISGTMTSEPFNIVSYSVDQPFKTYIGDSSGSCFASFSTFTQTTLVCSLSGYLVDVH